MYYNAYIIVLYKNERWHNRCKGTPYIIYCNGQSKRRLYK